MSVSIAESPSERVKRYLVQELKDEYGSTVVHEDRAEHVGTFTDPQFTVYTEENSETYGPMGWATCRVRVFSVIQNLDSEDAHEDTADLLSDVTAKVQEAVRLGEPVISSVGPPWYHVAVVSNKATPRDQHLRVDWTFDFKTGIAPGGIK